MKNQPNYTKLEVWKTAMGLVKDVYRVTNSFPESEKFSLTRQIRRSAISIPSNIAEGASRKSSNEFIHFLSIAMGSLSELDTQIKISVENGFCTYMPDIQDKIIRIGQMISKITKYLKTLPHTTPS